MANREIINLEDIQKAKNISDTFEPILNNLGKILGGFASNPVTGVPLMAATSETLYKAKILPRGIAVLLFSPSAILDQLTETFNLNLTPTPDQLTDPNFGLAKTIADKTKRLQQLRTNLKNFLENRKIIALTVIDVDLKEKQLRAEIKELEEIIAAERLAYTGGISKQTLKDLGIG